MAEWLPVDGVDGADIFAVINKPSITNSNAYLLRTTTQLLVFDPGASAAQVDTLNAEIADVLAQAPRRTTLFLTHAHFDHFGAVERLVTGNERPTTILHAAGALALREKDRHHTLAILYRDVVLPELTVDALLFDAEPAPGLRREWRDGPDGVPVQVELFPLHDGHEMEIYATPGHSTCSCTFRIGRHLIIGDVTFGASPGLAGLSGWSGDGLHYSIRLIRHLIERHDIATCWLGHGNALTGIAALSALAATEKQLSTLNGIAEMDEDRITLLRQFAVELLQEIERIFTLIGARLMLVALHLENLEEQQEAERLAKLLDVDDVETQIAEFRQFCRSFEQGGQPELSVAMKAAGTMGRLRRVLTDTESSMHSLASRAEHLIDAFLQTIRGLTFQANMERVALFQLVSDIVRREQSLPVSAEDFLAASDDADEFRRLLVINLSSGSLLRGCAIEFIGGQTDAPFAGEVVTDSARFQNILLSTLETLASRSASKAITIDMAEQGGRMTLDIAADGAGRGFPLIRARLYERAMEQIGGKFAVEADKIVIGFPVAELVSRSADLRGLDGQEAG
ncbi:MBL fold metallo-hydrolase [Corticibacterium sp. UT-5YL-CI-8]|nr:MBL fold metallo-hydrolase [Tianweitania sp. UT-5YL-CI-8]